MILKYLTSLILIALCGCSGSAGGQERPSIPIYAFDCKHEAVLAALAIEPYCGPLPVIHTGVTVDGQGHAEAYCEGLGYIRIIGTRAIGVYTVPAVEMEVTRVYEVSEYMEYVFGWASCSN